MPQRAFLLDDVVDDRVVEGVRRGNAVTGGRICSLTNRLNHIPIDDGGAAEHQLDAGLHAAGDDVADDARPRGTTDEDAAAVAITIRQPVTSISLRVGESGSRLLAGPERRIPAR